ncbi:MAG: type I phosphomannose isomerase catalytic subunit [Planctomycetota bacterium]
MAIARPLRLRPIAVPKVWGGDALRRFVSDADRDAMDWPEDTPVGEVWLISDREDRCSLVTGGPFDGRSLSGLMLSEREALLGEAAPGEEDDFPLLVKLIDARQTLSIQVHPDDAAAASFGSTPKGECWYLLDAEPDAEVYLGLADGVDATGFASGAASLDVVDLLCRYPVHAGEGVDISPGIVHAIGAGIVIAEVQNNSDTTYRIYDWERVGLDGQPRETHLDEALRSMDFEAPPTSPKPLDFEQVGDDGSVNRSATLRKGVRFQAEVLDVHEPLEMAAPGVPTTLLVLSGCGRLALAGAGEEPLELDRGSAWVLPADLQSVRVVDADGDLRILRARPVRRS